MAIGRAFERPALHHRHGFKALIAAHAARRLRLFQNAARRRNAVAASHRSARAGCSVQTPPIIAPLRAEPLTTATASASRSRLRLSGLPSSDSSGPMRASAMPVTTPFDSRACRSSTRRDRKRLQTPCRRHRAPNPTSRRNCAMSGALSTNAAEKVELAEMRLASRRSG